MSVFRRRVKGKVTRTTEEKRAKDKYVDSSEFQSIANRLGLGSDAPKEKIIFELNRLKNKSQATWNALKLTKKDFEDFSLEHR